MSAFEAQTVVVGAGVVGLACAAALAASGREVLVLERHFAITEETSSRNSEVIHAGIYYRPGSLKARLCVAGRKQLYRYCEAMSIPHRQLGKLIVASDDEELPAMQALMQRARDNGVDDLRWLSAAEAVQLEPHLQCRGAILSPSTGVVDTHQYALALQGQLESLGGMVSFGCQLKSLRPQAGKLKISATVAVTGSEATDDAGEYLELVASELVNCAGLQAVALARSVAGADSHDLPEAAWARGNYFRARGGAPFSHLVYPAPVAGGLGVHLTIDNAGNARFGPDVEPVDSPAAGYRVDPDRAAGFYQRIRRYWPELPDGSLSPDYAGIRPKIRRPGQSEMDFEILHQGHHGVRGLVHCLGIESPGLTSSLAIADEVVSLLDA